MTGPGTVTQFADRVEKIRVLIFLVRARFEITGVTTCTIGLVGRIRPRDLIGITPMTVIAIEPATMIARVTCGCMQEHNRRPVIRRVTDITILNRLKMTGTGASRDGAVMTAGTRTDNHVVIEIGRTPRHC